MGCGALMAVEEATITSGHILTNLASPAIAFDHAQLAVSYGRQLGVHAVAAHVLVRGKVAKVIALGLLFTDRTHCLRLGTTYHGHSWPDDAPRPKHCIYLETWILVVYRVR